MKLCQTQTLSAMSEASENNTKPHFGVYTLTPKNAPFYTPKTKAPYWKLKGWTIWGDRVRIRYELWEAGNTAQRQYEDADKEYKMVRSSALECKLRSEVLCYFPMLRSLLATFVFGGASLTAQLAVLMARKFGCGNSRGNNGK